MNPANYAFITARIKAKQKLLPDKTDIERMADEKGVNEAFAVFNDTDYSENLLDASPKDYYRVLMENFMGLKDFLARHVPDSNLVRLLLAREDFSNIKTAFKSKLSGSEITESDLVFTGIVEPSVLLSAVFENRLQGIEHNTEIHKAITSIANALEDTAEPFRIDLAVDKEYFSYAKALAKKIRNPFVQEYVAKEADHANLKTLLRAHLLGKDIQFLLDNRIPHGNITEALAKEIFEKDATEMRRRLHGIFNACVYEGIASFFENRSGRALELALLEDMKIFFEQTKYIPYGPEVVLEYFHKKMTALRNMRFIMIAKQNDIASLEIKKHIVL